MIIVKTLIKIAKVIFIIFNIFVAFVLYLISFLGNVQWLIVIWLTLFTVSLIISFKTKKSRLNFMCCSITAINLICAGVIFIGANPRPLTFGERNTIMEHLENRYGKNGFKIVSARSSNEKLTGLNHLFEFNTFSWTNLEVKIRDKNGCIADITGKNNGFGNIEQINEEYGVVRIVFNNSELFQDKIEDINAEYIDLSRYDEQDYIHVKISIDYNKTTLDEFDKGKEHWNLIKVRDDILKSKYCSENDNDVVIRAWYTLKDGTKLYWDSFDGFD